MSQRLKIKAAILLSFLGLASAAGSTVSESVSRVVVADEGMQQPTDLEIGFVVLTETAVAPRVCVSYFNTLKFSENANRGTVAVGVALVRNDVVVEQKQVSGKVRNNIFSRCRQFETSFEPGDFVAGVFSIDGVPKLGAGRGFGVFLDVLGPRSLDEEPSEQARGSEEEDVLEVAQPQPAPELQSVGATPSLQADPPRLRQDREPRRRPSLSRTPLG